MLANYHGYFPIFSTLLPHDKVEIKARDKLNTTTLMCMLDMIEALRSISGDLETKHRLYTNISRA
jgi:hypothetical protein